MPDIHSHRRTALRSALHKAELDALLVTGLLNVRYLTGYTGSNAALLLSADGDAGTVFCTDGRYATQSAHEVPDLERHIERPCDLALAAAAAKAGHRRTGFESHLVTVDGHTDLVAAADGITLVRAPQLVERRRMVKDEVEVEALRLACAAADRALADLLVHDGLRLGRTELEVARDLEARMIEHGAAGPAFDSIVAAGPNSAVPHHQPTNRALQVGDLVKLDFGALVDGYHSDITRVFVLGRAQGWQRDIYEVVLAAQAAAEKAVRAGVRFVDVDQAGRDVITAAGFGPQFPHRIGHGVGLDVHETPLVAEGPDVLIATRMTFTIEPGVYLAQRGGVRVEDLYCLEDARLQRLTSSSRDLIEIN